MIELCLNLNYMFKHVISKNVALFGGKINRKGFGIGF